jgi:predicted MFS family arabinose efflux permease
MTQLSTPTQTSERSGRRFGILWLGQAVSQFGDYLPYVSLPLFVKYLSDGTFDVALTYALDAAPTVIVGFLGGVLIDRWRLRATLIGADLLRAVAFGYLAWVSSSPPLPGSGEDLTSVFAVAFVAGTLAAFFNGALFAAVPRLVSRDRLASANGRLASTLNIATVLGPAAAGVLISAVGFWLTFAINSLTFVVSALCIAAVGPIPEAEHHSIGRSYLSETMSGILHLWRSPVLRTATVAVATVNLVTGFIEGTLVITFDLVGAGAEWQQGVLFALMGGGALLGSLLAPIMISRLGNGRTLALGVVVFGTLFTAFTQSSYGIAAFVSIALSFVGFQMVAVAYVTMRQLLTPDHLLGRVATVSRAIAWSTLPVGALVGASLSDTYGFMPFIRGAPVAILAVGLVLMTTVVWRTRQVAPSNAE